MKEVRLAKQIEEKDAIIKMLRDKYEEDTGKALTIVKGKQCVGTHIIRHQAWYNAHQQA